MKLIKSLVTFGLFLTVVLIAGCSEQPTNSHEPVNTVQQVSKFSLPPGATLTNAYLHINVSQFNDELVNIYGVSSSWDENTVTWNTKPTIFEPVEASFTVDALGWKIVDITGLVGKWLDGTYLNYGLLLDQDGPNETYAVYSSKEGIAAPFLQIIFSDGSANVETIMDAHIWAQPDYANTNFNDEFLYTGYVVNYEKQSLIKFDIEYIPQLECETAYAYDEEDGTCFIDLGFGNWGWSIYLPEPDTYTFPVYAAAGQCDITKGTYVGDVTAVYAGGTVSFTYNFEPGFSAEETHFYAGYTAVPRDRNNRPTVAPGQYKIGTGLSGGIYIIAHAVLCSSNWE